MPVMQLEHAFPPVFDGHSRILILGSFPSVASRGQGFYYGHPQNRFWPLLARIFDEDTGGMPEARRAFCLRHGIALWDVILRCEITGSSDASIRNVLPTELSPILRTCAIQTIYTNGATAFRLYEKHQQPLTGRPAVRLPSTSPANAAWSMDRLYEVWKVIGEGNVRQ